MRSSTRRTTSSWSRFKNVPELVLTLSKTTKQTQLRPQAMLTTTKAESISLSLQQDCPHLLSTLLPVSLSTTEDLTMDGLPRLIRCSHSSAVMKLWYTKARGYHDTVSTQICVRN
jgi:hypothetical protein